ncbi:unnamed protein product [Oikopleura dioica]|uniref:G-protein coupled receptors family 2 profile 2 domain-containing protein n=1 Tax=Oikopleura dioica TaxID=34765 RepID=E4Y826_OIKDI|nr:unnamed protein product [Oikopleura dioica]
MGNITVSCDAESGRTNYNESSCYKLESQNTECTAMIEDSHVFGDALGYNITACPELFIHKRMGQIHFIGKAFSFLLLLTAFIIFFLIRSVRCWRNTIHWNLITSLICQLTTESILAYLVRKHIDINNSYPWICRLLYSAQNYFQLCMYHWLLVEGIYLYVMVGVVYNTARVKMWMYKILGWGVPALIVSLWAVFASYVMEDQCWMSPSRIEWIRRTPILMILATNLFILLNIIRILITQGNTRMINQNKPSEVQQGVGLRNFHIYDCFILKNFCKGRI